MLLAVTYMYSYPGYITGHTISFRVRNLQHVALSLTRNLLTQQPVQTMYHDTTSIATRQPCIYAI